MEDQDLYAILGVSRGASNDEIRKSYRALARKYHPDVNPGDAAAEERFKSVSFAYEVLSDREKRALYDEFGLDGLAEGFDAERARAFRDRAWDGGMGRGAPHPGLDDLLRQFFGGRGFGGGSLQGDDIRGEVAVDFMDAVRGGEVRVQVQKQDQAGRVVDSSLRIRIPPGADSGTRIRLAGQGQPGLGGGRAGDLYLTLKVRPHKWFEREGSNLLLDLPVTLPELLLGGKVEVPTPDGPVTMEIPPRSQNGQRLRVRGKGVYGRTPSERGDLIVRLVARLPTSGGERIESVARDLEGLYGGTDVRSALKGRP